MLKKNSKILPAGKISGLGLGMMFTTGLLILAACQNTTPTMTQEFSVATEEPAVLTEEPEPTIEESSITPAVFVEDQALNNNTVTASSVVSDGEGWLVIHAEAEGKPGPILGYSSVVDGENSNVVVGIDKASATEKLFAMLHVDEGEIGIFEFPDGPDSPVTVDGKVVTPAFQILAEEVSITGPELNLGSSDALGPYFTDSDGMTLYLFTVDDPGLSNCYDQCAENWPPFLLEEGQSVIVGDGINGELGTTTREDGGVQVTYNGFPLYYWINDEQPGDMTGHGVSGVWAVVSEGVQKYQIDPSASLVTYEVGETFLNQGNRFNVAVGTTNQVEGDGVLDLSNPLSGWIAPIEIDISQFTSGNDRRDNALRNDFLESAQYPIATFVPTEIQGLPREYSEGDEVPLQITGDLTVREVTLPVTFETVIKVENGELRGEAASTILMSDFGIGPISILGILETEDEVRIKFSFVAVEQSLSSDESENNVNSNDNTNENGSNSNDNDNDNTDDSNENGN